MTDAQKEQELVKALRRISELRIDTRRPLDRGVNEARMEMQRIARETLASYQESKPDDR